MPILIFFVAHWYLSLFVQTFFLHRYAAHSMFSMSKATERFFYIFTYICQGSSYLSARAYGIMHRVHHEHTDTENDPHSPKYDKNIFAMLWRTRGIYLDIFREKVPIDTKHKINLPDWAAFEKLSCTLVSRAMWIGIYIMIYQALGAELWMYIFIPVHVAMGPIHGVIVNWFAHKVGYTNHKINNTSTNLMPWDLLMMGEGLHNNHHRNASSPNFGYKKFEFDPTYPIIIFLDKIGVIKLNRAKVKS